MNKLIKGGRVIDPKNGIDGVLDVRIKGGRIAELGPGLAADAKEEVIAAAGKVVCPGFIDLHVHLRDPGYEYKEDIISGTRAAAAGGFTAVCCMPNTDPIIDTPAVAHYVLAKAAGQGVIPVLPFGSITRGAAGKVLTEMGAMAAAGCAGFSDDGVPVESAAVMRNALEYAKMFDLPIVSHSEERALSKGGLMHEGYFSTIYGLKGIPALAEELAVHRDIELARLTGSRLHLCHLSTAGSVALLRRAKAEGLKVTGEVTPHHLTLTDELLADFDTDYKVNPPLRSAADVEALIAGLNDGTVDAIATDHAPHHFESKDCEFELAAFGISGLETAVAAVMEYLVRPGRLSLPRMVELLSCGPAGVIKREGGSLSVGAAADICIIDPELSRIVDPAKFFSQGKNTPYKGRTLTGWPIMTIAGGRIVYEYSA
ncbi:MAG: dihydroorotase [Syntrophomonadaceae bacterium]|nr:dihydroorotase [Syntrophomonadaceae bacterium]